METERIEKEALEKIKRELHGRSARALSAHIHDVLDKAFDDLRAAHEAECEKIRGIVEGRAGDIPNVNFERNIKLCSKCIISQIYCFFNIFSVFF